MDYVWFVAPALLATAAVTVAMDEFTFVIMAGFKWRRIFWGMNASPIAPPQIAAGLVISVVLRMLFTCTIYYLLILAFGAVGDPVTGALMPLVGVLGGLAFGLPLMAFSARLTEDKGQFALVQRFVFTPLFLFSGTFFPLDHAAGLVAVDRLDLARSGTRARSAGRSRTARRRARGPSAGTWRSCVVLAVVGWVMARRVFVRRLRAG